MLELCWYFRDLSGCGGTLHLLLLERKTLVRAVFIQNMLHVFGSRIHIYFAAVIKGRIYKKHTNCKTHQKCANIQIFGQLHPIYKVTIILYQKKGTQVLCKAKSLLEPSPIPLQWGVVGGDFPLPILPPNLPVPFSPFASCASFCWRRDRESKTSLAFLPPIDKPNYWGHRY